MVVLRGAVGQGPRGTLRTVDRRRAVIFGAIQRHQQATLARAMGGQFVPRHQRPDQVDEHRRQLRWRDGIKQVANLRRGWDLVDPEQRGGVVATALFLHPLPGNQETREGTQAGIPHRLALVVAAFAGIRQIA